MKSLCTLIKDVGLIAGQHPYLNGGDLFRSKESLFHFDLTDNDIGNGRVF